MKVWDKNKNDYGGFVEVPKVEAFIEALIKVYKEHNMSLGHEDHHGAFMVESLNDVNISWLRDAHIDLPNQRRKP